MVGPMPTNEPQPQCPSNSRYATPAIPPSLARVESVGVDTVSFAWRLPRSHELWALIAAAAEAGVLRNREDEGVISTVESTGLHERRLPGCKPGEGWATTRPVGGVLWFFDLAHGLIFCEGRLACLLDGHEDATGLRPPAHLPDAACRAAAAVAELRIILDPGQARVRRLDLAGDIRFPDPRLGASFLRVLLESAEGTKQPYYNGSVLGTIGWKGASGFEFRCYDRGAWSREHPAGELLRLERQWRPEWHARNPASQPLVNRVLDEHDLVACWLGAFSANVAALIAPLLTADDAQRVIHEHLQAGRLPRETAVRLLGTVSLLEHGGFAAWGASASDRRVRNQAVSVLRELGIEVISPEHRRGTPWPTYAYCRPAGLVLRVRDVVAALRAAMQDVVARSAAETGALASMSAKRQAQIAALATSLGWEEEPLAA